MNADTLCLTPLTARRAPVEMVERKGIGHPDTICDALAENLSRKLCAWYIEHFGAIAHHNVDKALLCAGIASPRFGGGQVDMPMDIHLGGRATGQVKGKSVPIDEIVIEDSRRWLRENLHALNADKHVRIHNRVRHGSSELVELFGAGNVPLANDTSLGVGYAPLSPLENLVHALDAACPARPEWGEDYKIMAVRVHDRVSVTVARAIVDAYVNSREDYAQAIERLRTELTNISREQGFEQISIQANTADNPEKDCYFLTVTGTSAESGDDGQVGRGNRANGLITPYRPMSLEALAGKNPVNHVGKLYNVAASAIANRLVHEIEEIAGAECMLVSQIGRPITDPLVADVGIRMASDRPVQMLQSEIAAIVQYELNDLPSISQRYVAGDFSLF